MKKFKFASLALCGDKDLKSQIHPGANAQNRQDWTEGRLNLISREIESKENSIQSSMGVSFLRSLDHLIRPLQHAAWNCQTDLFGGPEINDELKLRCLLHRQIRRLGASKILST